MPPANIFDSPPQSIEHWLSKAKNGSSDAVSQLLAICRNYLLLVANRELDTELQAKFAASDLVQDSLYEAQRDFVQFEGNTEADILSWLRRILLNNLGDLRERFHGTQKREIGREVSLEQCIEASGKDAFRARDSSLVGRLIHRERQEALKQAIATLPPHYTEVLQLRHQDGCSFEDIGQKMGKTADAARKLWARAVEQLKTNLKRSENDDSL